MINRPGEATRSARRAQAQGEATRSARRVTAPAASRAPLSVILLIALLAAAASATPTATFKVSTFAELNKGEPQGTFISSKGEVVAGRASTRLRAPAAAMMWSSARGSDGTVYLGTGDEGTILAVKGDQVRKVAELKTVLVTALAIGPEGKLLAGTMPDAKIALVDPATGNWRELARLPAQHIWALLYDAPARTVYAASGSPGKIYAVPAGGGKPDVYFDPGENHLLCLARERSGAILAGSADGAVLYRVAGKGRGFALHDFDATELRDLAVRADGTIYAAVNKFERRTSGLPRFDRTEEGEAGTPLPKSSSSESKPKPKVRAQELRPGSKSGKGAIFGLDPEGQIEEMLALDTGYFTDLELDLNEVLWAGDGTEGKVYLIYRDRTVVTAFDLPERQVLVTAVGGPELYLGTGDAGAVYRVSPGPGASPIYLSQTLDAKFPARWGSVYYQATGDIQLESRTGNTAKPDKTWAAWQPIKRLQANLGQLVSPAAQYLQLRMTWRGAKSGALRSFTAYYLPRNQRARVSEITVGGDKDKDEKKDKPRSPKIRIKWKAENPDGDTLTYRVYFREELGVAWRLASGPDPLDKAEFEWDTEPIPDGHYRIKVVASDERDNPEEWTLTDEDVSERVLVDNRKPAVSGLIARWPWVVGTARDSYSPIRRIEYSIDGERWRLIAPIDGIYDGTSEGFRIRLPDNLSFGIHVIAVRALDEAENLGVSQVQLVR